MNLMGQITPYATVDHDILPKQLADLIDDPLVLTLIDNMLARLDDVAGMLFTTVERGISKGNPLSPLLGAVYLSGMDQVLGEYCKRHDLFYRRFMDDWIILCRTRHQLRTVVRLMNQVLEQVKMTKHPYKTYIGRIKACGVNFFGYLIKNDKLKSVGVAWQTWANHRSKFNQLYEQGGLTGVRW